MKKMLLGVVLMLGWYATTAQQTGPLPCGNPHINTDFFQRMDQLKRSGGRPAQVNFMLKVYFTVFENDDGTEVTAADWEVANEFTTLVNSFAAANICFVNMGLKRVKNTNLNNNFNAITDFNGTAFNPYRVPDCINLIYIKKINGNNNACPGGCGIGGIAIDGIPGTFLLMSRSNVGRVNSVAHEMGHCLGLLHTFENVFGFEKIDGSNSTTAGDKVTDTPADPYVYGGLPCYSMSGCNYNGTCTDSNGQANFTPPYNNLMGYWSSALCFSNPVASTGQFNRTTYLLTNVGTLFPDLSPMLCNATEAITNFSLGNGYYMKAAVDQLTVGNNVTLAGTVFSTLAARKVTLQPGFRAWPTDAVAKIRIIPSVCQ